MFPVRIEKTIKFIRKTYFLYKRGMYYKGIAWGEINALTDVVFHAISIITMLKVYGVTYSIPWVGLACIVFTLALAMIGKLMKVWGIIKYGVQIGNENNPWSEQLERIENKLDEILKKDLN